MHKKPWGNLQPPNTLLLKKKTTVKATFVRWMRSGEEIIVMGKDFFKLVTYTPRSICVGFGAGSDAMSGLTTYSYLYKSENQHWRRQETRYCARSFKIYEQKK